MQVTAVLEGQVRRGTTARVSFVLSRDHSGDMDLGVIASDGSHAVFYLGMTGQIQHLRKAADGSGCEQWVSTGMLHACGPRLQVYCPETLNTKPRVWWRTGCGGGLGVVVDLLSCILGVLHLLSCILGVSFAVLLPWRLGRDCPAWLVSKLTAVRRAWGSGGSGDAREERTTVQTRGVVGGWARWVAQRYAFGMWSGSVV